MPVRTQLFDIGVSGGGSHILVFLFSCLVGQRNFVEVFFHLLGITLESQLTPRPGGGLPIIKELKPADFLKLVSIRELKKEDQIRRWIFLQQLLFVRELIREKYFPRSDWEIRLRWNRNKTLVMTANQLSREEGELIFDFGGGQLKSPYSVEDHDAFQLLTDLESGDPPQICTAVVRLSALVGKLMAEAAKNGHIGFKIKCLCTGKYWQKILTEHQDKFANFTFEMEWIDGDQERALEFEGFEEAFKENCAPEDLKNPGTCVANVTSGGSSCEIWSWDGDQVVKMPFPHGSKSDMFGDKDVVVLPPRDEMMELFRQHVVPPESVFEDPIDDGPPERADSRVT